MKKMIPILAVGGLILTAQDSCEGGEDPTPTPWVLPGVDYAQMGSYRVVERPDAFSAPSGCEMAYTQYYPDGAPEAPLVMLSHGFQRNQSHMVELARHLASWGLEVVTPNLCHSLPTDSDTGADAGDMLALSDLMGAQSMIYMGHSAGGLRSTIAGVADDKTRAVLGLDLVDGADEALNLAPQADFPLYGIVGEGSACNAGGNGVAVFEAAPQGRALKTIEADHCDFEGPTDALCTSFCQGSNDQFSEGEIRRSIWGLATSFAVWHGGLDAGGADWWQDGGGVLDALLAEGHVVILVD